MWTRPDQRSTYAIGIDSGTKTGLAIWDRKAKVFVEIKTTSIHKAIFIVKDYHERYHITIRVEDARLATMKRQHDAHKAQGAGSVKRDAAIWEGFLKDFNIDYKMVRPNKIITKMPAEQFRKTTGFKGLTSEHGRDAAMLVYGL